MSWRTSSGLRDRLAAGLTDRRLPWGLAALSVLLCLPALGVGWQADDYFHRVVLRGDVESEHGPLELFSVMRHGPEVVRGFVDLGLFPWWTSEELRLAFFRYLSAFTHWLDYRLWPDAAPLQHAHSLLWLGGLVVVATRLYRRILGATWVAGLAALLYAVDDAHGAPAGWLANRNALIATFFGLLCLLAHDRWRQGERRQGGWSALWLALALAAGEMGLGAFAYLVAYAVTLEPGGPRQRWLSLAPATAVLASWAVVYRLGGFGTAGSGLYVDPAGQPVEFARRLVERAPFLLGGQLTPLPAESWLLAPEHAGRLWGVMTAAILVMAWLLAPLVARRPTARFWALGGLLAVVPLCGTFPANRLLFFVGLGAMGLVAEWLEGGWRREPSGGRLRRVVATALLATHLVLAPLTLPLATQAFRQFGQPITQAVLSLPDEEALARRELVVVNAPEYLSYVSQAGAILLSHGRRMPRTIRGLAIGPSAVTVQRIDARTLDISMARGYLHGPLGELFHDSLEPFAPGSDFSVPGMTATVMAATPRGTPRVVRFRFDRPLESPVRSWMQFRDGRYEPFLPPPIGGRVELPAALGPLDRRRGPG